MKKILVFLVVGVLLAVSIAGFLTVTRTRAATPGNIYVDGKLGFSLQFPVVWTATPHSGIQQTSNSAVTFTNASLPGNAFEVGVTRDSQEPERFAQRGKPSLSIGGYPVFKADTAAGQQIRVPCLVRIMLVHNDRVIATWCSQDKADHAPQMEQILATYQDTHPANVQSTLPIQSLANSATHPVNPQSRTLAQSPVNPVLNCGQVIANPGPEMWLTQGYSLPSGNATFGTEQVAPTDATWENNFGEGVAVCDDYVTTSTNPPNGYMFENSYLFQCVELANRFINEEWGLQEFTVDAFAYYDNYENGSFVEGQAKQFFGNQVQQVDDATQGTNTSLPQPGDLLIFQDVNDGTHWTSGELAGWPGHVAVVTSANTSQVTIVQENYNQTQATLSLTVQHGSNGYHIVDQSGLPNRITRGWIHFTEETAAVPAPYTVAGDFNGDGKTDIANFYSGYSPIQTRAWVWPGASNLPGSQFTGLTNPWTSGVNQWNSANAKYISGDFNGDGHADVIAFYNIGTPSSPETIAWMWPGTSSGLSGSPEEIILPNNSGVDWTKAEYVAGDFTGNGYSDVLLIYNSSSTHTTFWLYQGSASLGPSQFASPIQVWDNTAWNTATASYVAGDVNGDGYTDLIGYQLYSGSQTRAWVWQGAANLATNGFVTPTTAAWTSGVGAWDSTKAKYVSGDFNGDGYSDVIAYYDYGTPTNPETSAWIWFGTPFGLSNSPVEIVQPNNGVDWTKAKYVAGHFSGNGYDDVVLIYQQSATETRFWMYPGASNLAGAGFASPTEVWDNTTWDWNYM